MSGRILSSRLSLHGPGRAGRAFLRSWLAAGGALLDVVARDPEAAGRAVRELGAGRARAAGEPLAPCDILVLAVPDDAIADTAAALGGRVSCRLAFHLSGALPAEALAPLEQRGAAVGSLHPLRAFTGAPGESWRGALVAVEGDSEAAEAGLAIAGALGARGHRLTAGGKALYHAGAQLAAAGTVAVVSLAARAWEAAGLDPEAAREALGKLAEGAAAAVAARPFAEAFTGAVARRDVGTIRAHAEALAARRELLGVYARLAEETLARTPGRGREEEIRKLLAPVLE
jgi:predicted short-subunit dehydrogenase-like oxidoreductase (DUF2520 family)